MKSPLTLALALIPAAMLGGPHEPVRVFVGAAPDPSGFVTQQSKDAVDSAEDLRGFLKKHRAVRLVASRDEAQVVVEVVGRGLQATGSATASTVTGPFGAVSNARAEQRRVVAARVIVGDRSTDIAGKPCGNCVTWRNAAQSLAGVIAEFIEDNRTRFSQ